jgi:beta-glucosidase/6-phospho-beta-glucosidase/beta-galactosidase
MEDGEELAHPSSILHLPSSPSFIWCTGIEDTFITAPHTVTSRTLDEYELTQHYKHWRSDLNLLASLGVRVARYGVPWHRIQPTRRRWDWRFADATLNHLLDLGIDPIVDLVHYGLPPWIENAYLHPDYPRYVAEYAARLAERFRGRIRLYTPLNEPRITAWYCGKLGWWPPGERGWGGFVQVMLAVCRGIVETARALKSVDESIAPVHVDAADLYRTADPTLKAAAKRRQSIGFLALDLITGRVNRKHELFHWLVKHGASAKSLGGFQGHAVELPMLGINLYPMFSNKMLMRTSHGLRIRSPYGDGKLLERIATLYWNRYRVPIFITETASVGSVARRSQWLADSVAAVRRLRQRGIPMIGYTWWPMFALVTWAYRQGTRDPKSYLKQMGLWDLQPSRDGELTRAPTRLVAQYHELIARGDP